MSGTLPPDLQKAFRAPAKASGLAETRTTRTIVRVTHQGPDGKPVVTQRETETTTRRRTWSVEPYDALAAGCVIVATLAILFLANGQLGPKTGATIITALLGLAGWAEYAAVRKRRRKQRKAASVAEAAD